MVILYLFGGEKHTHTTNGLLLKPIGVFGAAGGGNRKLV
jgi:hypothetical protein